jgi:hypothetical protein
MFHADITGFPIGMIDTGFQIPASFFSYSEVFAKAFEIIADLNI